MRKLLKKDKQLRKNYAFDEMNQLINSYLFRYFTSLKNLNNKSRAKMLNYFYKKYSLYRSKTKIVRRCVLTNRSRSSIRLAPLSRIKLREMIRDKQLTMLEKAIW